ncbi:MAG: phenylalanine--tRNA ligase subunit beta [Candidatus Lokiarchaeota archaeon]|nr:phenylalanine--tRNA ligase subunit beta [Candidatus Lokiarchaeota archaeon]MBD3202344.1 phenylalanine--tRNA ligase subunit beta [Candidatus Lokiarchaeota archaeon]
MPTLELKIDRLEKLVGKELEISELEYDLQWISLDLEDINEEEQKIKVEYNPNRPDFASPEGIARALKGYYEIEEAIPKYDLKDSGITLNVDPSVKKVRPYIVCGVVRNVDLDEDEVATLMNIQEQLHWAVGRDRKKVAIGVHNIDAIEPPFLYTAVKPDSVSFEPLHGDGYPMNLEEILLLHEKGIEYAHILEGKEVYPIIFDKKDQVLSFPPIINGVITTVTDETKNLFLDLTGTDFKAVNLALNILTTTLSDMGATIEAVTVNYKTGESIVTPNLKPTKWEVDSNYINDYIGLDLSLNEMIKCFKKVRMDAEKSKKKGHLNVYVPAVRGDIIHPVDFAEECAIGYGYYNLPKTIREGCIGRYHPIQTLANKIRTIMIGAGYLEVLNFILSNSTRHYKFMRNEKNEEQLVQIANPVSKEYNTTRTALLPKLLETIQFNRSEEKPIRIFEVGDVILLAPEEETGAKRKLKLAVATYHEDSGFTEIRSVLDFIMNSFGHSQNFEVQPGNNPTYLEGRYGEILLHGNKIGELGEIHPEVLQNFKLEFPVAALEIDCENFID